MRNLKTALKSFIPASQLLWINNMRSTLQRWRNGHRPAHELFDDIYEKGLWGGSSDNPCSGAGSRGAAVDTYVAEISRFIAAAGAKSVLDIGCGDFHVGRRLLDAWGDDVTYTGLDVSSIVIAHNTKNFGAPGVTFICGDACTMELPAADVCLVRQVLQHLSNDQIEAICRKFSAFRHVVVTEHIPSGDFVANKDKRHGADIRLAIGSGISLDRPPFSLRGVEPLFEVPVNPGHADWGRLLTVVISRDAKSGT